MTPHPLRRRRLATTAAVLVAVGLAFGACSDSDSGSNGAAASSTTSAPGAVAIKDFAFQPGDLKVAKGTTVTFTNEDGFDHTVTAKDKSFDSEHLASKGTFEHTFDEAGSFPYLCAIHNSMTGTITVS
jgi:plastocyanin